MAASHYQKNHIFKMLKNALNIIWTVQNGNFPLTMILNITSI
jgi:hypothetical protein